MKSLRFLGAPADSVGRGRGERVSKAGAERAPAALRELGLPAAVLAEDGGDLAVRIRGDERDPATGLLGSGDVLAATRTIRAGVAGAFDAGAGRVFVAGGCCAVSVGAIAGARDALGRIGLAYVDGHQDLWDGSTSASGEAADMPLATVLGLGPSAWVESAGGASVAPADLALLGDRDAHEFADRGLSPPADELGPAVFHAPAREIRASGAASVGAAAADRLAARPLAGFWLHLDVDVLDEDVFPATDYLDPGGLDWTELAALLRPLASSSGLVGASIGCYNPDKDPGLGSGARLVRFWGEVLG